MIAMDRKLEKEARVRLPSDARAVSVIASRTCITGEEFALRHAMDYDIVVVDDDIIVFCNGAACHLGIVGNGWIAIGTEFNHSDIA